MAVVTPKPLPFFDKKGTTSTLSDEAASAAMSERVAKTNKPAPSAAGDASIVERGATVDFAKRLQGASRSDAADMRKAADDARYAPPAIPKPSAKSAPRTGQVTRNDRSGK